MWACGPEIMCWIFTLVPFHTSSQLLTGGASGFGHALWKSRSTSHHHSSWKRALIVGKALWKQACPAHAVPQECWSERSTQGLEDKRDVETEEETRRRDQPFNRHMGRSKIRKHILPAASLYCLSQFGLERHLILPANWRRSQAGIRKSL